MADKRKTAVPGQNLILLFGMSRSGTTWLGKLFDSHPDTLYRHEPDTWQHLAMPRYPMPGTLAAEQVRSLRTLAARLSYINSLRVAGKRPLFPKAYIAPWRLPLLRAGVAFARAANACGWDVPVLAHASGKGYAHRRLVWKSIESLGRLGVILEALPGACGIHILRHPCGYIASVMRGVQARKFTDNSTPGGDFGLYANLIGTPLGDKYDLNQSRLARLTPEERLAWSWVLLNEKALSEAGEPARMLRVRYEDVCAEPHVWVERMFAFTGLSMTDQTRAFIDRSTTRRDSSYYSVFKDPMVSAMRWEKELAPDTIARIMAVVEQSPFAETYGATPIARAYAS